jgi:succinate-acetate transporter protein
MVVLSMVDSIGVLVYIFSIYSLVFGIGAFCNQSVHEPVHTLVTLTFALVTLTSALTCADVQDG